MHMSGADPNNMYNRLNKEQKHIMLIWLHSNWLTDTGQKKVREIYENGMYNQGKERQLLIQLRYEWINMYKRERNNLNKT